MRPARPLLVSLAVTVMAALFVVAQEPVKKPPAQRTPNVLWEYKTGG